MALNNSLGRSFILLPAASRSFHLARGRRFWCALALLLGLCLAKPAQAEVRLPKFFSSHMVLQQNAPIIIWGWANPNETVQVSIGDRQTAAQANERGEWKATLPAMAAGGPYKIIVTGSSTVECDDVLVGEVWLCSGQSNMEMGIGRAQNSKEEIAEANHPNIRLLLVAHHWAATPQDDIEGTWKVCTPENIAQGGWEGFSAVAYFFGRNLESELHVPIGLIDSTWGGTRIESWTPPQGFADIPALAKQYHEVQLADPATDAHVDRLKDFLTQMENWVQTARQAMENHVPAPDMPAFPSELRPPHDVQNPTALYNGMIYPLRGFGIRGAIWYQGESNMGEGQLYLQRMKALVAGWRDVWHQGEFPFDFVQIAPYNYGGLASDEAELWEAQADAAQQIPNAGMAVINDIGNLKDIHPTNKQEVGRRLALIALAKTYGQDSLLYSGPTFKSMNIEDGSLRVTFDHAGSGLRSRDGQPLSWFEIIDANEGGFVPAQARIDGDSVILTAPDVKHPVAVRFAWSMLAEPNLVNSAGLPAGAFRAGEIPKRDLLSLYVPEAKQYQLVYDLDLNTLGHDIHYSEDHHLDIHQAFDRVAYSLELEDTNDAPQFVFVSMDAFTDDLSKIGVPTATSHAHFQQNVESLDVFSNVRGITTGTNLPGGNIEFWPNNYGPANSAGVPHASNETFDFGDQPTDPEDGYGSMQVHNHDARQTIFALNHWSEGGHADVGIGNHHTANPDWTFAGNAASYPHKRLRIFVRLK